MVHPAWSVHNISNFSLGPLAADKVQEKRRKERVNTFPVRHRDSGIPKKAAIKKRRQSSFIYRFTVH
jgi:hypothetical protein